MVNIYKLLKKLLPADFFLSLKLNHDGDRWYHAKRLWLQQVSYHQWLIFVKITQNKMMFQGQGEFDFSDCKL